MFFFGPLNNTKKRSRTSQEQKFHYQKNVFLTKMMHLCSAAHNNNRYFILPKIAIKRGEKEKMKRKTKNKKLHNQFWVKFLKFQQHSHSDSKILCFWFFQNEI
jgi:hypothetical protein